MKVMHMIAYILVIVGGLNWLLQGIFGWDVGQLFGGMDALISRIIYILVGLAAIWEIFTHKTYCKYCAGNKAPASAAPQQPGM